MDEFYWYWLCNIRGIGREKIKALLTAFETPENVYHASQCLLEKINGISAGNIESMMKEKRNTALYENYCELKKKDIHFTYQGKADYPEQFLDIYDGPYAFYYKGKLPDKHKPIVSIVGARNCTEYGKSMAREFAFQWAKMGLQIVSGMALGIDTAAHRGALQAGGYTCAILGSGVDVCYPRENIGLYTEINTTGGILSEYVPDAKPIAGQFPMRNRLISGLADVVVVIEARKKSGSLITVDQALEQNKDIMAMPGRIGDLLSEGCNRLVQMGAQMLLKPEDILYNSRIATYLDKISNEKKQPETKEECHKKSGEKFGESQKFKNSLLASKKDMLYSGLNLYPTSINTIIEETQLSIPEVSAILLDLELEGLVKEVSKGCYVRMHL